MELKDDNDSIDRWPYNVWKVFNTTAFPSIFSDDNDVSEIKKKKSGEILNDILKEIPKNCACFLPDSNVYDSNYENILNDYKYFNVWFFGQLVAVYMDKRYENLKNKCLETLTNLLQYLCEKNQIIYCTLLRCNLNVLQDVCNFIVTNNDDNFQNTVFEWFEFTSSNLKFSFSKINYTINNSIQLTDLINLVLQIFTSQIEFISNLCTTILPVIWQCLLSLLKNYNSDKSIIYKFISCLISENELPHQRSKYSPVVAQLLTYIMNDISTLCQIGKLNGEEEFRLLLKVLAQKLNSNTCFDFLHIHLIYCSILQCQVSLPELTEEAIHNFFRKLLCLCSNDYEISTTDLEPNLPSINLSLLFNLLETSITKQVDQILERGGTDSVNIYRTNKNWRFLINCTLEQMEDIEKKTHVNTKQVANLFKLVHNVTELAANMSYRFRIKFTFFDDEIHRIFTKLTNIAELHVVKKILLTFLNIIKNILMLNESDSLDEKTQLSLIMLLNLPWLSSLVSKNSLNFYEKYALLIDTEVRELCINSLMWTHRHQFEKWKHTFLPEVFNNIPSDRICESLPVFVRDLNDQNLNIFLGYLFKSNAEVIDKLSKHVRSIVCALDGQCTILKLRDSEVRLYCLKCDTRQSPESNIIVRDRKQIISNLIIYLMKISENSLYNILSVADCLFNHVEIADELLLLLQNCFTNENEKIRMKIVEITPSIVFAKSNRIPNNQIFCSFVISIRAVTLDGLINENADMQYRCINAIVKIGCVPLEATLLPSVSMLISLMMSATSIYAPLVKNCIQQIATAHDMEEEYIFLKYREFIFPLVTRILVINFTKYNITLKDLRFDYSTIFNSLTLNQVFKYLLPYMATNSDLQCIVNELAQLSGVTVDKALQKAFKHIFTQVWLFESADVTKRVMEILYKETNMTISDLLGCCVTGVLAQLLIYYEELPEKVNWVISEIKRLATASSKMTELSPRQVTAANIESYIKSKFFGILMSLENQLCSEMISSSTRRRIFSSLKSIIGLLSKEYITSIRFKMLFTLRTITTTENEKLPQLCIGIWDTFVRAIDKNALGPILSTIFTSLLPFAENHKQSVNDIFRYLVIENNSIVEEHLRELYFVRTNECDDDIFRAVRDSETRLTSMSLQNRLEWLQQLTKHDVVEIKLHALKRLKYELANNHEQVSQLILGSDSVSGLVFQMLDVLVEGFRNRDESIQEASAVCLGEFGAVDPSYIPNTVIKVGDSKKYNCYNIEDVEFAINTFTVLCRGFQMAKMSSTMDKFALAIQNMLKTYNVKECEECEIWSKIPKNLREIIQPFYSTTYKLVVTGTDETDSNVPHLVYGSNGGRSVQKWAFTWSNYLISLLPKDSKEKDVFTYCKGPMSYDNECLLLFLPHILLNAVLSSDDVNHAKIYDEMSSVLRHEKFNVGKEHTLRERSCTQLIANEEQSSANADFEMDVMCVKTIFTLLDVLCKKYRDTKCAASGRHDDKCRKLYKFLNKFSKYQLAEKSFEHKEYTRSLLYIEEHLTGEKEITEKCLVFLANTYKYLNDVDNIKGLFAKYSFQLRHLQHVIMLHEITDQFQDAAICYQQLLKTADSNRTFVYEKRMIQCYLAMNQPETALRFVKSLSTIKSKTSKFFYDVECEALWNLSQYDKLEKLTSSKNAQLDDTWGVRIGQSIVYFLNGDQDHLQEEIQRIRNVLTKSLHMSSVAFGGYRECYDYMIKLHILNEFEKVAELVFCVLEKRVGDDDWKRKFQSVIETEFEERLNKLQPISRILQPVLNIRQVLFSVAGRLLAEHKPDLVPLFNDEIRKCWLKMIEIANRTRNFQLAYSNIIAIDSFQLKGFFIEKAKYYWEKSDQQEALRTLHHGLELHYSNFFKSPQMNIEDCKIYSEAMVLIGKYNDTIVNTDFETNLEYFQNAVKAYKNSEKALVWLAQYIDKILNSCPAEDLYRKNEIRYQQMVEFYGKSLKYGCEFIYQSLTRMLNVWMDFGVCYSQDRNNNEAVRMSERREVFIHMNRLIQSFIAELPTYYFYTAFSLIMSRIKHPVRECFNLLKDVIVRCVLNFPNQVLWHLTSLHKSKLADSRFGRIVNDANLQVLMPLIQKFKDLFERFTTLCCISSKKVNQAGPSQLTKIMKNSQLLDCGRFDEILIPAQKFLTITLPRSTDDTARRDCFYNPFPEQMVNISQVLNEVYVYNSLQKPLRITLLGTDGQPYPMIFKAIDDLRIDSRCMEFSSVVNMYLKRDVESRDRALHIRTYTVLPLIDKCGIIEFIPNLETMRMITKKMRRCFNLTPVVNLSNHKVDQKDPLDKRKQIYHELCELHPPVLHEWFKMEFPNPSLWYMARTSYIRTLAVMSIVGYMIGLGDRHNDNILLDYTNGNVIHVDFNMIFNKGESLAWPERVPFRLTETMVKAMGPLGYEGSFRCTCEIVNRILRNHKEQLTSVLNTFWYDPPDFLFTKMHETKKNIELKFNGAVVSTLKEKGISIPLSVEGQTRKLIEEATDEENLYQMFQGWNAFN